MLFGVYIRSPDFWKLPYRTRVPKQEQDSSSLEEVSSMNSWSCLQGSSELQGVGIRALAMSLSSKPESAWRQL